MPMAIDVHLAQSGLSEEQLDWLADELLGNLLTLHEGLLAIGVNPCLTNERAVCWALFEHHEIKACDKCGVFYEPLEDGDDELCFGCFDYEY